MKQTGLYIASPEDKDVLMSAGRDAVLTTAAELFAREGIGATGVDTIIREAGVAKMTLYNHFGSKAELVAEYLRLRDRRWWDRLDRLSAGLTDPRERLLAFFDGYRDSAAEDDYRGCPFLNGAAEVIDPDHPAYAVTRDHKRANRDRLRAIAVEAGAADPDAISWQLTLLLDGATANANLVKTDEPFAQARAAAAALLDALLPRGR